ncbi:serine hydrolase domain-containing protein [Nocardia australiensis]|uniref:serine hydrolase domain-containing protein n=1 Tax=Nocardia australiensis TaxID=2887191 RepID=UPI001D133D68|nr:serine hydrolase domain-containing protein [Nocardia australiensis]
MKRGVLACAGAVLAGVIGVTTPAHATAPPPPRLQEALDRAVAEGYPGVIAYARNGSEVWRLSAGTADRASQAPAETTDRFRIASNTKAFVATVVLQLAAEGRLGLDDPIERILPGVVRGNGNDGRSITVRELLNNTSGIYDPTTDPAFFDPYLSDHDWGFVYRPHDVVAAAMTHPPLAAPGTTWSYSNTNYLLAGMVVEAVTGHPVQDELRDRLLIPLGLTHTTFPLTDPQIHGPHLHGYDLSGNDMTTFSPSYDWTAGALISTLDDLAQFHRALFGGHLLPPDQQRALETPVTLPGAPGYGLGVQKSTVSCGTSEVAVWETDGGGPGFTSIALTSADGSRQLILVGTVFDLAADLRHEIPVPRTDALAAAQDAVFCP